MGSVTTSADSAYFRVIINHFTNFPLIGYKVVDFLIFKQVFIMMQENKHLTQKGLGTIVALKANQNKGCRNRICFFLCDSYSCS